MSSGSSDTIALKRQAAAAALRHVESGMVVGLGTGSTASLFITELGREISAGRLRGIRGIPTSDASRDLAREAGVPVISFADAPCCDVTVDGADEIDPSLNLIKGLGGALLREKIVAQSSKLLVIVADASKLVERLGSRCPLPVEVIPFGMERQADFFRGLGGEPALRADSQGRPFVTDSGNRIYDVRFGPIDDPRALETALLRRAGVVETGLFLDLAGEAIVATGTGLTTLVRA